MTGAVLPNNATPLERELAELAHHVRDMPVPVGQLWNADTCPAAFLPWLAWALSVDTWRSDWPEATKRAVIKASPRVHRLKGTRAAVVAAVSALIDDFDIVEWFAPGGSGEPYTARIETELQAEQGFDALAMLDDVLTAALAAAGARDHLVVRLKATLGGGGWAAANLRPGAVGVWLTHHLDATPFVRFDFRAGLYRDHTGRTLPLADAPGLTVAGSGGLAQRADGSLRPFAAGVVRATDLGLVVEAARTNKCAGFNANPVTVAGITTYGDAARVFSVVDDTAALAAAGLAEVCTSGKVFKLDNSAGTSTAYAVMPGSIGNLAQHIQSVYARGSGAFAFGLDAGVDSGGIGPTALTPGYQRRHGSAGSLPTVAGAALRIEARPGAVVYFILFQLEEGGFVTSPVVVAGAPAARSAQVISHPRGPADAWTVFVEAQFRDGFAKGVQGLFSLTDAPENVAERVAVYRAAGGEITLLLNTAAPGGGGGSSVASAAKPGARVVKLALAYSGGEFTLVVDGGAPLTLAGVTPATAGRILFGRAAGDAAANLNDLIRTFDFYGRALAVDQLQALTA